MHGVDCFIGRPILCNRCEEGIPHVRILGNPLGKRDTMRLNSQGKARQG